MHPFQLLLALFAVALLIGMAIIVRWERRYFHARGQAGPWLAVRLSTIPIALATAALVIIPARNTSGMEGLAVFYGLLFTAAPLLWFGSHWLVGKMTTPRLSLKESARIAGSPIVFVIGAAMVAPILQSIAWSLLRSFGWDGTY